MFYNIQRTLPLKTFHSLATSTRLFDYQTTESCFTQYVQCSFTSAQSLPVMWVKNSSSSQLLSQNLKTRLQLRLQESKWTSLCVDTLWATLIQSQFVEALPKMIWIKNTDLKQLNFPSYIETTKFVASFNMCRGLKSKTWSFSVTCFKRVSKRILKHTYQEKVNQ